MNDFDVALQVAVESEAFFLAEVGLQLVPGLRVVFDSKVVACLRAGGSPNASVSFTF